MWLNQAAVIHGDAAPPGPPEPRPLAPPPEPEQPSAEPEEAEAGGAAPAPPPAATAGAAAKWAAAAPPPPTTPSGTGLVRHPLPPFVSPLPFHVSTVRSLSGKVRDPARLVQLRHLWQAPAGRGDDVRLPG